MRNESEENARLVTCRCQICNGAIEFDDNDLNGRETASVPCPHCTMDTIIFAPPVPKRVSPPIKPKIPLDRPMHLIPATATKPGPVLYKVMRSMVIAWTLFCILGMGGCSLVSFLNGTDAQNKGTEPGLVIIFGLIGSAIWWLFVWIIVAVPCATIYMVSKKKE